MARIDTLFIVGPTASGKSALALRAAQVYNGELVCADSQTIRRDLTIGTAKPSREDQAQVRHHLLDIIGPYDEYSAADFKHDAEAAIADIQKRGRLPIIVGGTGLYIDALFYDYAFSAPPRNESLRNELAGKSVAELQSLVVLRGYPMPVNDKNPRHLIRTLETGGLIAQDRTPREGAYIVGLMQERHERIHRITERINHAFENGLIDEVELVLQKYGEPKRRFDAIAYQIVFEYMQKKAPQDIEQLKGAIVQAEVQYAKRQLTWFRRNPHIHWYSTADEAMIGIQSYMIR